jgi:hypothetical protein
MAKLKTHIKNIGDWLIAWPLIGLFYLIIYYGKAQAWWLERYYTFRKIPFYKSPDKFGHYIIRLKNPIKKDTMNNTDNKNNLSGLKQLFLEAPDTQMDPSLRELVAKWDEHPTAIQILEVLDKAIYWGAASGFVVSTLQMMLDAVMIHEGTTLEELAEKAVWRNAQ